MSELETSISFWLNNLYDIPEDLIKKTQKLTQDLKDYKELLDSSLPLGATLKTNSHAIHKNKGEVIIEVSINYKINLGLCWSCYDCKRTFTDQPVAWMRSVGGHYQERTVYTCKECVSYWYGRENYGKEKPDYLVPNKGGNNK